MPKKVGIEAIYIYVPEFYVDNTELAIHRGTDPKHFTEGLGITRFGVPSPNEDHASMAATAALRLMEKQNIRPMDIFRIDTPTESSLDNARALVSDVIGMLEQIYGSGSFSHVLGYEQKFACISGIERVLDSSAWCAAGWNEGKYALVITTDNAKYNLKSREEPTQGAAAAAILIGVDPELLEVVPGVRGSSLRFENMDFKKPEGREIALVNGERSVVSYLCEMDNAWRRFSSASVAKGFFKLENGECILDHIDRVVYHNPHKKMVMSAYGSLLTQEWRSLPRWNKVANEIGDVPTKVGIDELSYYGSNAFNTYRRKLLGTKMFYEEFKKRVWSSTLASELVGDPYTASLFVGIDSIFENDESELASKTLILCGYGSGSHALIQACIIPKRYKNAVKKMDLMPRLALRHKLSIEEYEVIHEGNITPQDWHEKAKQRFILEKIEKNGTKEQGNRKYSFAQ